MDNRLEKIHFYWLCEELKVQFLPANKHFCVLAIELKQACNSVLMQRNVIKEINIICF